MWTVSNVPEVCECWGEWNIQYVGVTFEKKRQNKETKPEDREGSQLRKPAGHYLTEEEETNRPGRVGPRDRRRRTDDEIWSTDIDQEHKPGDAHRANSW